MLQEAGFGQRGPGDRDITFQGTDAHAYMQGKESWEWLKQMMMDRYGIDLSSTGFGTGMDTYMEKYVDPIVTAYQNRQEANVGQFLSTRFQEEKFLSGELEYNRTAIEDEVVSWLLEHGYASEDNSELRASVATWVDNYFLGFGDDFESAVREAQAARLAEQGMKGSSVFKNSLTNYETGYDANSEYNQNWFLEIIKTHMQKILDDMYNAAKQAAQEEAERKGEVFDEEAFEANYTGFRSAEEAMGYVTSPELLSGEGPEELAASAVRQATYKKWSQN